MWMDDTPASEVIPKGRESHTRDIADRVIQWSQENRVCLNSDIIKCKELRISFSEEPVAFDPIVIVRGGRLRLLAALSYWALS